MPVAAAAAVAVTVTATAVAVAVRATQAADEQERVAVSRGAAAGALALAGRSPDTALLLALEAYRLVADEPAERSYEARNAVLTLLQRNERLTATLRGHAGGAAVAFAPDGRTLATGDADGAVRLWRVGANERAGEPLEGADGQGGVQALAFAATGRLLAGADVTGTVRVWDTRTRTLRGPPLRDPSLPRGTAEETELDVLDVAVAPDGTALATAGEHGVRLWHVATGSRLGRPLTREWVDRVLFRPDGRMLVTVGDTVRVFDLSARPPAQVAAAVQPFGDFAEIAVAHLGPDGRTLTLLETGGRLAGWDVARRPPRMTVLPRRLTAGYDFGWGDSLNAAGTTLAAAAGTSRALQFWDVGRRARAGTVALDVGELAGTAFSPDGSLLAVSGSTGVVRLVETAADPYAWIPLLPGARGHRVVESPDGRLVAAIGLDSDGGILGTTLWDTVTRTRRGGPLPGPCSTPVFSPDGRTLALHRCSPTSEEVVLVDTGTGKQSGEPLPGVGGALGWSADGRRLLFGRPGRGGAVLWEVGREAPTGRDAFGRGRSVEEAALAPDGRTVALVGYDPRQVIKQPSIRLWDAVRRQPLGPPLPGGGEAPAFSPDGATLAYVARDGSVRLWDVDGRRPAREPVRGFPWAGGEEFDAVRLLYSPDGRVLVAALTDTGTMWDVARELPLGVPVDTDVVHLGDVVRQQAALVGESFDLEAVRARVCTMVARSLTKTEWNRFLPGEPYRRTCG